MKKSQKKKQINNKDIFGKWTVIEAYPKGEKGNRNPRSLCKCECGLEKLVIRNSLKNGSNSMCRICSNKTHDMTKTKVYTTWVDMKRRCFNKKTSRYHDYGGRGITVCDRWKHSFENFFEDMGERPEGLTLDRKDNDKNYYKDNCRWATQKEQANNRSSNRLIDYNNQTKNLKQWSEYLGINYGTLKSRLNRGWSVERAFTK